MVGVLVKAGIFHCDGLCNLRAVKEFRLEFLPSVHHHKPNQDKSSNKEDPRFHCLETTKKRTAFSLAMKTSMEVKALEVLRTMIGRRGLDTKTEAVASGDLDRMNAHTIGDILVVFSQKDRIQDRDLVKILAFATAGGYNSGTIVVGMSPASDNFLNGVRQRAKASRVQYFHIRQLQFDIMSHRLAVPHRILNEEERTAMFKTYKISNPAEQLPWIDSQDTMVKWTGALPGDILEVTRHSDVAGTQYYYRYCVADVNVA